MGQYFKQQLRINSLVVIRLMEWGIWDLIELKDVLICLPNFVLYTNSDWMYSKLLVIHGELKYPFPTTKSFSSLSIRKAS